MPSPEKSLKAEYFVKYCTFIGIHIIGLLIVVINSDEDISMWNILDGINIEKPLIAGILPVLALIINGLLSSNLKAIVVFWRVRNALPGCRVFSQLAINDSRIDIEVVKDNWGEIPTEPNEQNTFWYKIYKKHQDRVTIKDAHRNFLFARDLTSFCALSIASIIVLLPFISLKLGLIILSINIFEYISAMIATRNYGNRFVCNVLAEESAYVAS